MSGGEKFYSRTQKAPREYKEARYAYIDSLLIRIHDSWNGDAIDCSEGDIERLKVMYSPILEQIKRELKRSFRSASITDLEDCVHSMLSHLIWKYDPKAEKKRSFSMWLKNYLKGWCYRFMNDLLGTGKKSGMVLASAIRDSEMESSYTDIIGASEPEQTRASSEAKSKVAKGFEHVRLWCGDKSADAFVMKHMYGLTQSEIAEVLGCTQAKVSKILVEAENSFKEGLEEEE